MRRADFTSQDRGSGVGGVLGTSRTASVLLGIGLFAVAASSILAACQRNWPETAAVVGLSAWLFLFLCSRRVTSQVRAHAIVALCYAGGTVQLLMDAPYGSGPLLLLGTVGLAGALLKERGAAFWCSTAIVTALCGTMLYSLNVLRVAEPPALDLQWWLAWGGSFAVLAATAYFVQQFVVHILRREAVEDVRKREKALMDAVMDSVPGLLYLYDEQGRLLQWNKQFEKTSGCTAEQLAGKLITDWYPQEDFGRLSETFRQVVADGHAEGEATFVDKDGVRLAIYYRSVRLVLDGKHYVAGIAIDISQRKAAEEAIRKSETLYRTLFESAHDAIYVMNGEVFVDCNPSATKVLGYSRERLVGHSPVEFSPERQSDGRPSEVVAAEKIQAALRGTPQFFEWLHTRENGELASVEVSLCRTGAFSEPTLLAILRDVTDRKRAEESLRKLSQAVEQSPVNVVITDLEGNIEYVNPKFCAITGYTSAEVLGKNPRILKSGHTSDEEYRELWQTITSGREWSGELLNKAKDGSTFWERAVITSIKDKAGRITHFLAVKEDITDQRKADGAIQEMRLQLTHAARLSTLGEMVAELAHELNHPLYAILNYAKASRNLLADEGMPDVKSLREWNEEIASVASSAGEVVRRLRTFAGRAESPRAVCRIEDVIEETLELCGFELRHARIALETSFAADLPPVEVDRIQIQQVIVNLLSNAIDAMQDVPPERRQITIQTLCGDEETEIAIADRGVGLPLGDEQRLFEPFVSTKPEGLGLGLSIASTIVTAHGGRLWAASNTDGGATFHFTLPLRPGGCSDGV
jgi:PAS domain S-box-containing protein